MTTVPTGQPAWTRTANHEQYGGHLQKTNYQSQGVVNPRTDVGAEHITRMAADLAAVVNTAPFAALTFRNQDSEHLNLTTGAMDAGPAAPLVQSIEMMTGIRHALYIGDAPPTGFPSAVRDSAGKVTITFAESYADAYGIEGAFTPRHVVLGMTGATFMDATWRIVGNTIEISCFDATGAALGDREVTVIVT